MRVPLRHVARGAVRHLPTSWKSQVKRAAGAPSMEASLRRLYEAGFRPRSAIDIGAYRGEWTQAAKRAFPDLDILMVEAQSDMETSLRRVQQTLLHVDIEITLLGAHRRTDVPFILDDTASRVASPSGDNPPHRKLPMTTLDDMLSDRSNHQHPDLIKLDVQGLELDVLKGGAQAMASTEVVIAEINLLGLIPGAPLVAEAVAFMDAAGFQLYDIAGLIPRPFDGAPWQADAVFVRSSSDIVSPRWDH